MSFEKKNDDYDGEKGEQELITVLQGTQLKRE